MSRQAASRYLLGRAVPPPLLGIEPPPLAESGYNGLVHDLSGLLESARRASARAVMTYWEIGRRIVEYEQGGKARAEYGAELLQRLGKDLTHRFGRGFSRRNLQEMRGFYLAFPDGRIRQTPSAKSADG